MTGTALANRFRCLQDAGYPVYVESKDDNVVVLPLLAEKCVAVACLVAVDHAVGQILVAIRSGRAQQIATRTSAESAAAQASRLIATRGRRSGGSYCASSARGMTATPSERR